MKQAIHLAAIFFATNALAQEQAGDASDYLCISGVDHANVDVWLLRTDGVMYVLEEDGKVETELSCSMEKCQGNGFTISFSSSYARGSEKTFATVVREGDPNKYVLDCTKQN